MAIIRQIEDKNLVVTILSGRLSSPILLQSLDELPKITPNLSEMYELVINADNVRSEISTEINEKIIKKAAHVFKKFARATISIVCQNDLVFRTARQFARSIVNEQIDVSVFRTEETARKWIDEIRSFHRGIDKAFHKKYNENTDVFFSAF